MGVLRARCFCGQIRAVVNGVWIFRYGSSNASVDERLLVGHTTPAVISA